MPDVWVRQWHLILFFAPPYWPASGFNNWTWDPDPTPKVNPTINQSEQPPSGPEREGSGGKATSGDPTLEAWEIQDKKVEPPVPICL
ncbi:hypothetical protein SUGI_0510700 [Cryptomeria japonica]|nr:hypothetical protein SUGI_0510700 [Cryptomeria japonica]